MKLVLYQRTGAEAPQPGLLVGEGVVDLGEAVGPVRDGPPQQIMTRIIDHFHALRPEFERLAARATPLPLSSVRLRAPLPRPGKILCCIGNYWEHMEREPRPLNMFLKNPDAVVGPGDTIILPEFTEPYVFHHEAELAIVIKGPAKKVAQADYRKAIFGYTCLIDVSARAQGRQTWRSGSWMGKSFDTFAPLGPCIVTADEIPDPNALNVRFWNTGDLLHDYNTNDMEHRVPELIEFATAIMTLSSGDVIACGTNHEGLGPLQDGDIAAIAIEGIGRMALSVVDPLKRTWERGVYMGPNSTAPAARAQSNA
ncbi:MAG: fumarylacetoacetate hydrolase family protein [Chloroflexi bacterium]|nr:fumarylacetoacetate hydrolase family protein [Chloroflexota bacterium]